MQIPDVVWSDGIEQVKFGHEMPQLIMNWNLVAAGSHRARSIVSTILQAKENGQPIEEVVWDAAYPMSKPEFCGHPLHRGGIEQTFRPAKRQQWIKPFSEEAVDIAGQLFSSLLPNDLKQVLPMPPRDATLEERLEFERPFNRRARFRYGRHAGPDADGTTRWECPVHGGRLRARECPGACAALRPSSWSRCRRAGIAVARGSSAHRRPNFP